MTKVKEPWEWDEADLQKLLGTPEGLRLEFKSGRLLEGSQNDVTKNLSRSVSAFANTEGGVLLVGIDEKKSEHKSGPRLATAIDGASVEAYATERLQQIIEGNISPYLPGIRVRRIKLAEPPNRVVFVVQVPAGSTAYQASDRCYYGRSEFEAKALPDHEIRLRMARGRAASAKLIARQASMRRSAQDALQERLLKRAKEFEQLTKHLEQIEGPKAGPGESNLAKEPFDPLKFFGANFRQMFFSEYSIEIHLMNVGDLTLRDFEVVATASCAPSFLVAETAHAQPREGFSIPQEGGRDLNLRVRKPQLHPSQPQTKLWPGTETKIGELTLLVPMDSSIADSEMLFSWKVFLDDAPASGGEYSWIDFWPAEENERG